MNIARRLFPVLPAFALLLAACGGSDTAGGSSEGGSAAGATDTEVSEPVAVAAAPDLTPEELCDLVSAEDLVAVVDGELTKVEPLDGPPQCSVAYANSQAVRDAGGANGTNLLIITPTSEDLEGKTGDQGMEVATQYVFYDSEPDPVDVADGGLSNGKFLYFTTGGRIVGVAAGDGTTPDQLVELAKVAAESLAP